MKWLPVLCLFLFPVMALGQDNPAPAPPQPKPAFKPLRQQPSNVVIVNGKKFFLLDNARRFTGSTNSPRALSVMHHPRPQGGNIPARRNQPLPSYPGPAPEPSGQDSKDKLLSIFAPEEKPGAPAPTK